MVDISEDPIIREANAQREHERLMRQDAQRSEESLAEIKAVSGKHRRVIAAVALGVLAAAAVIVAIIWAITDAQAQDRRFRDVERERQAGIARTCIEAGNIWIDDDCLLAVKSEGK